MFESELTEEQKKLKEWSRDFVRSENSARRSLLSRAWSHIRRYGLGSLVHDMIAKLDNHWYDISRGTDTSGYLGLDRLSILSPHKDRGVHYGPSKRWPFLKVMKEISPPKDCTFVDVGCGKGKVLLMAMDLGFRHVTGIEFSPELCRIARKNVEVIRHRTNLKCEIEIIEGDAADYVVRSQDRVFFFFDPFDDFIMSLFIDHVVASLNSHPRRIWLILSYPSRSSPIEKSALFQKIYSKHVRGTPFAVYANS
jgi:SAM-dependent methyltransferase